MPADILANYAERLRHAGGRLYLVGLSKNARSELLKDDKFQPAAGVETYEATPVRGASTRTAYREAEEWLLTRSGESDEPGDGRAHDSAS